MERRKEYRRVPNFNLMPPEHRIPTISLKRLSLRILLVLVIAVELLFVSNMYQQKSSLEAAIEIVQLRMQQIDNMVAAIAKSQGKDAAALEATLQALRGGSSGLRNDWKALGMEQPNWSAVIAAFYQSKPGGIQLTALNESGGTVNVAGTASDYQTLLDYYQGLLISPVFSRITLLKSGSGGNFISFSLEMTVRMAGK